MAHRSCLGDRATAYSLGRISLGAGAVIAQEAYLCAGTHDFDSPDWPLITAQINIGRGVFIGARAFLHPGISVGDFAIVGAGSIVTRDVESLVVCAGNPARAIGRRAEPVVSLA